MQILVAGGDFTIDEGHCEARHFLERIRFSLEQIACHQQKTPEALTAIETLVRQLRWKLSERRGRPLQSKIHELALSIPARFAAIRQELAFIEHCVHQLEGVGYQVQLHGPGPHDPELNRRADWSHDLSALALANWHIAFECTKHPAFA